MMKALLKLVPNRRRVYELGSSGLCKSIDSVLNEMGARRRISESSSEVSLRFISSQLPTHRVELFIYAVYLLRHTSFRHSLTVLFAAHFATIPKVRVWPTD